jgi:hypothetical protein
MLRLSPYYSSSLPFLFIFQLRLEFAGFFFSLAGFRVGVL